MFDAGAAAITLGFVLVWIVILSGLAFVLIYGAVYLATRRALREVLGEQRSREERTGPPGGGSAAPPPVQPGPS